MQKKQFIPFFCSLAMGIFGAPNPVASPYAVPGGTVVYAASQPPKSLNYYLDSNTFSAQIFGLMFETLLSTDPLSAEFIPGLAESWTVSEDKLTFTFVIDTRAHWSDGNPVTAEDVKWTFDQLLKPENMTGAVKVSLASFDSPEIVNQQTIRFKARSVHWRNLLAASGFEILPKHIFEKTDFNTINFRFPVVCGPYQISSLDEGRELTMTRRTDWWGFKRESNRNTCNFETLRFRFFADPVNAFEAFKKGDIDLYPVTMSRIWNNETQGEKFDKNWIIKQRIENKNPIGFQGFAMNLRRPPFNDARVRQALAYLLDRDTLNRTLMYGAYFLQKSYFEDLYDTEHPCPNRQYAYNTNKAAELLTEAGYVRNVTTGRLEKNGNPFEFTFLTRDGSTDNFLAFYSDALKNAGISMKITRKDFASWMRDMDTFNYEMTWAAWSSSLYKDPESMWSSAEADRQAGNNITGFKSPEVDRLIEEQKTLFAIAERNEICRKIDRIVTDETPYILLWNINATRLLYWNKFGMPKKILGRFGDDRAAILYWWYDKDNVADLKQAIDNGSPLPKKPERIVIE